MSNMNQLILLFCLLGGVSLVVPMRLPRRAGYSSKSEENPQMGAMYGYSPLYLQLFQQQQQPTWPQQQAQLWPPHMQQKPGQTATAPQPGAPLLNAQQQPTNPVQHLARQPPANMPGKQPQPGQLPTDIMQSQIFPPFGNALNPYQIPWLFPQMHLPGGFPFNPYHSHMPHAFGRPPGSNEEGGFQSPYFGYYGFGGRPPYFSEELEPEETANSEVDSPKPEPAANTTTANTNSTAGEQPGPGGEQEANATSGTSQTNPLKPEALPAGQSVISPTTVLSVNISEQNRGKPHHELYQSNHRYFPANHEPSLPFVQRRQMSKEGGPTGPREIPPLFKVQPRQGGPKSNVFAAKGSAIYPAGQRANLQQNPNPYSGHTGLPDPRYKQFLENDHVLHYPGKSPSGQHGKAEMPSNILMGQTRNLPIQRNNLAGYRITIPHKDKMAPSSNSNRGNENAHYQRGGTAKSQPADSQPASQQFPKGIVFNQRKDSTNQEKQSADDNANTHNPTDANRHNGEQSPSAGTGSSNQREHSPNQEQDTPAEGEHVPPAGNDNRKSDDSVRVFEPGPSGHYNASPFSPSNHVTEQERGLYMDTNHYDFRGWAPRPASHTWDHTGIDVSPAASQQNTMNHPSIHRQGNWHSGHNPFDQTDNMIYARDQSQAQGRNFNAFEVNKPKHDKRTNYPAYNGENTNYLLNKDVHPIYPLYKEENPDYNLHQEEYSNYPSNAEQSPKSPIYREEQSNYPAYTGEHQIYPPYRTENAKFGRYIDENSRFPIYKEVNPVYRPYNPSEQPGDVYYHSDRLYNEGEHSPYDALMQWNRSPVKDQDPSLNKGSLPFPSSDASRNTNYLPTNPYDAANPWESTNNFAAYGGDPPRNYENTRYHSNSPTSQRESLLYPTGNSWDPGNTFPRHREAPPHAERHFWGSNLDPYISGQTERSPYSGGYPADLQRAPSHHKATLWGYGGSQMTGLGSLEQGYHDTTVSFPAGNAANYRGVSDTTSPNQSCCKSSSPVTREHALARKDDSPYMDFPTWDNRGHVAYHENSHSKHARHVEDPAGSRTGKGNDSTMLEGNITSLNEKMLPFSIGELKEVRGGQCCQNHSLRGGGNPPQTENIAGKPKGRIFQQHNRGTNVTNVTAQGLERNQFARRLKVAESILRKPCVGLTHVRHDTGRGTQNKFDTDKKQVPKQGFRKVPCFKNRLIHMPVNDRSNQAAGKTQKQASGYPEMPTEKASVGIFSAGRPIRTTTMEKQNNERASDSTTTQKQP